MTKTIKITPHLGTSQYGNHEPELRVTFSQLVSHREERATLHELAAQVERASGDYCWLVHVETGRVYLELDKASAAEAVSAMAILHAVAKRLGKYKIFDRQGNEVWVTVPERDEG